MRGRRILALLVIAAVAAAGPAAAAGFERTFTFAAEELSVMNLIGEVHVAAAPGDRFEVRVAVQGKDADPDLIVLDVAEGRAASLDVRFPLDRHRDYIYPRLGRGGRITISPPEAGANAGKGWLERLLVGLGSRTITVREAGRGLEVWADVTVLVPRERLADVKLGAGKITSAQTEGELGLMTRSGPVKVADHRGPLTVDTGSGSVEVDGVEGDVMIDTGSGGVVVADHHRGALHVDTGSGGVTIARADATRLHVDTGSGGVKAQAIRTDSARIDTGSGAVVLELERMGDGPFVIDTGSGGVRLSLPAAASALITADTGSGGIRADVPGGEVLEQARDRLRLRVGDGAAKVTIDTGSGGVTITGR